MRYKGFEPAEHHRLIIREIEAFLENDDEVLLLFAPPGCAKSTIVSILLPSYYLARNPKNAILAATHSGDFALRWGRRVRNDVILESEMLGVALASDSQAADRWALTTGGEYYGVGAGVGIAGFRADLGVIDDLFGTREDAFSAHIRQKRWDWYVDDFSPRLKPGAKRIVMATRWHLADVSGRILEQIDQGKVRGRVISIAAKAEENDILGREVGEYLWDDPDGYNYGSFLRARERETDAMMWSALYQQRPAPETGDYWKAEWLRPYSAEMMPNRATLSIYGGSDWAVTSKGGDYTVHLVVGVDPDGKLWLLDLWRGQEASDVWVEQWCAMVKKWKPLGWAEEKGQIASGVGPFRDKVAHEREAYVAIEQFPTRGDKARRQQSMRGRVAQLGLYVPTDRPWYPEFRAELMSFPAGAHDDQCLADGTLIAMGDGRHVPIEKVSVGNYVATPCGPCRVDAAEITNQSAEVFRVDFSDGRHLIATGNHPVYVENKGFTRIDELCIMDQLATVESGPWSEARQRRKSLNIAATVIDAIRTARLSLISAISMQAPPAAGFCTGICGRMLSGQFLRSTTFTTSTRIGTTTLSTISSALRKKNTARAIRWLVSGLNVNWSFWVVRANLQKSGILLMPAFSGIARTERNAGKVGRLNSVNAYVAVLNSPRSSSEPTFAREYVDRDIENTGQTHSHRSSGAAVSQGWPKPSSVFAAVVSFLRIGRTPRNTVQRHAVCVIGKEVLSVPMRVRNLTVSHAHTFYANGILTHNCDALGLVGQLLDVMIAGRKPKEPESKKVNGYSPKETTRAVDNYKVM